MTNPLIGVEHVQYFFFMGIERGSLDSSVEKLLLITFSTIKIINFDVNELHLTKKKNLI
jgi:hypothetical protein